jgi:hypothetical protein
MARSIEYVSSSIMRKIVLFLAVFLLLTGLAIADQTLPPDPGEAGKQTLLGIDSDNDGVRDDIQRYIYFAYPDNEKVRITLTHISKEFQELLLQADNREAASMHVNKMARHGECLFYIMGEQSGDVRAALKAEIMNTEERTLAYITYSENLAGTVISGTPIREWRNSCAFDVDSVTDY